MNPQEQQLEDDLQEKANKRFVIPIRCLTDSGYFIDFENISAAVNVGVDIDDIIRSIKEKKTINTFEWFLKNENDLEKI